MFIESATGCTGACVACGEPVTPSRIDPARLRKWVFDLPPVPQLALDALATLRDDRSSAETCAARIGRDPPLAARALRLANSVFYGMAGRIGSLTDAVHVLGRRQLHEVVTVGMVVGLKLRINRRPGFDHRGFWGHSLGAAIAARGIARELAQDEGLAFTGGLLHDIGGLVLAQHFDEYPHPVAPVPCRHGDSMCRMELHLLGIDHAEVGEAIVSSWRLPQELAMAIRRHHEAWRPHAGTAMAVDLAGVVHAADSMIHAFSGGELAFASDEPAAWEVLGLKPPQIAQILQQVEEGVTALGAVFEAPQRRQYDGQESFRPSGGTAAASGP